MKHLRSPLGLTLARVLAYIETYNRLHRHNPNGHDEAMTKRHYGIAVDDFDDWPGQDLFAETWREGTPYGAIATDCYDFKRFEPATGFDLASQDWPPPPR